MGQNLTEPLWNTSRKYKTNKVGSDSADIDNRSCQEYRTSRKKIIQLWSRFQLIRPPVEVPTVKVQYLLLGSV